MLSKCRYCGFYVSSFEGHCPNCGLSLSLQKIAGGYSELAKIPALFALFFSLILALPGAVFLFGSFYSSFQLVLTAIFLFITIFTVIYYIQIKRHKISVVGESSPQTDSLTEKQKLIESRIAELGKRSQKIDAVLNKIKETDGKNLQEVRQKLLSAREIVASQSARYELQKQKIELVRLQNRVVPYLFSLHDLSETKAENALLVIENTKKEVKKMRRRLKKDFIANFVETLFPEKPSPEKESFLRQLKETENSCEELREAVLSRQAAQALEGISPLEENLKSPEAREITHASETFNIQTVLTDFSASFEELEREYQRILRESEASQKLLET